MTPDKNNFQFRNDGSKEAIEAKALMLPSDIELDYEYIGMSLNSGGWFTSQLPLNYIPIVTPSEALTLLRDTPTTTTMLQELETCPGVKQPGIASITIIDYNPDIKAGIGIVVWPLSYTERGDDCLIVDANNEVVMEFYNHANLGPVIANLLNRHLGGYTLDANGKPVAIRK